MPVWHFQGSLCLNTDNNLIQVELLKLFQMWTLWEICVFITHFIEEPITYHSRLSRQSKGPDWHADSFSTRRTANRFWSRWMKCISLLCSVILFLVSTFSAHMMVMSKQIFAVFREIGKKQACRRCFKASLAFSYDKSSCKFPLPKTVLVRTSVAKFADLPDFCGTSTILRAFRKRIQPQNSYTEDSPRNDAKTVHEFLLPMKFQDVSIYTFVLFFLGLTFLVCRYPTSDLGWQTKTALHQCCAAWSHENESCVSNQFTPQNPEWLCCW